MNNWPEVLPPMVMTPLAGTPVSATLGFIITTAPFVGTALTHLSTDWEIRTASNGGGVARWSSMADNVALLVKTVPIGATSTLLAGQTYYIRVRYNTSTFISGWSEDIIVTT